MVAWGQPCGNGEGMEGNVRKGHQEAFGFDGYFHYHDCGDEVYILQKLSNCAIYAVYGMLIWW